MVTKKITFIIVNYNSKELLVKCVENLLDIWPNRQIIVVDNGSTDGSLDALKEYKEIDGMLVIPTENNGISAAHNLGLEKAEGDYICYLGTDAYPTKESIKDMFGFMEISRETGILTPRLVLRDGSIDKDAHRGFPTPWTAFTHFLYLDRLFPKSRILNKYFMGWEDYTKPHVIDACISHFMFTRKEIYEQGIIWDEDYFVFGEDIDFCYKVKNKGFKVVYLGNSEVLHYKGATIGRKTSKGASEVSKPKKETRLRMAKASTQSMRLFYSKHYKDRYSPIVTFPILVGINLIERIRVLKVYIEYL